MSLKTEEQFLNMIEKAKRPLIALPKEASIDDYVSAFSLKTLLKKLEKEADLVSSGGTTPKSISFLAPKDKIHGDLSNIRKLTLHVGTKKTQIKELSYDILDEEIRIDLTPKTGAWSEKDIRISTNDYKYDLIFTIGALDLDSFADLYKKYADFFFQTPIINIDHRPENEHFGQINLVDINAVSSSEVCHNLFCRIDKKIINAPLATMLLTGMISKTKSFKAKNVTPKTLDTAAKLISLGAEREMIVENLYKTRTVETLRLWGRALARLKSDPAHHLIWTVLTKQDFVNAGTDASALESVIEELLMSAPEAKIAMVFYENNDHIEAILHAERPYDALSLGAPFRASGTREEAHLTLKSIKLLQAEQKVIQHLKEQVKLHNA